MKRLSILPLALLVLEACGGPRHVAPFTTRQRTYKPGEYAQTDPAARPSTGSIFSDAMGGYLQDTRAVRVGDVLIIHIDESADASGGAKTALNKDSSLTSGTKALLGILPALKASHPDINPDELLDYASKMGFAGEGNTSRKGELNGKISVRVTKEMPNGDLFLEGTKVILINNEEYHLYVSGLARRTDIAQDNSVPSSRVADAQIEFTGRGDIADTVERGWLGKILDKINPF